MKNIFAAVIFTAVLVFISVYFIVSGKSEDKAGHDTIVFRSLFFHDIQKSAMSDEIANFTSRYSSWAVDYGAFPYREIRRNFMENTDPGKTADILTVTNPAEFDDTVFHSPPIPWSGNFWVLYYSIDHLTSFLGSPPQEPASYAELLELFEQTAAAGLRPLSFGASYGWPLTSLVQHLAGSIASPDSDGSLALEIAAATADPSDPRLEAVYSELRRWLKLGWISPQALELPWTAGVTDVISGKAAFTLLNQQFFDAVPEDQRTAVRFFSFPADWAIGSIVYLARPSVRPDRPAVREFEQFLLSPGVVDRLEKSLSVPYFGGVRDAALPERIIPSVTGNPSGSYHRGLWNAVRDAIR